MKKLPGSISAFSSNGPGLADAGLELLLHLLEQRLEPLEVLALLAVGDLLGGALLGAGADMAQTVMSSAPAAPAELGEQFVVVDARRRGSATLVRAGQQALMVQRRQQRAAFLQRAQAVEAHGIEPLEDVAVFAMLRGAAVLLDKALDLLEARR